MPQSDSSSAAAESSVIDAILAPSPAALDPAIWSPGMLRLARRVPVVRDHLEGILTDPYDRAEAGLAPPIEGRSLSEHIRMGLLRAELGLSLPSAADAKAWETEAEPDPTWWVPSARLHVLASIDRERQTRAALSEAELPYVFPGELHARSVDVLAGGDRVLTALHVDWLRKVTRWVGDTAVADARALGFWFWPHLRYLAGGQLKKPFKKLLRTRRLPTGAYGMAVAYHHRIGQDWEGPLKRLSPEDRYVAAVAIASDHPDAG
ncbi:MAG: hypothetical protein CL927_11145 [Deltaproteobacteria bacterium]|nr:hypothetical protein [Deltaproteobacteria bacterium]HCH61877.1 hypothetical protein [Deltaproteobacteria bacterium]